MAVACTSVKTITGYSAISWHRWWRVYVRRLPGEILDDGWTRYEARIGPVFFSWSWSGGD